MSNEEFAGEGQAEDQAASAGDPAAVGDAEPEAVEHAPVEVELQRSVRYARVLIGATVIGVILGAVVSLFFPVAEDADYTLGQVAGLSAVIGGVIGLAVGAILALLLGIIAKRSRGAALAVQTDVR